MWQILLCEKLVKSRSGQVPLVFVVGVKVDLCIYFLHSTTLKACDIVVNIGILIVGPRRHCQSQWSVTNL